MSGVYAWTLADPDMFVALCGGSTGYVVYATKSRLFKTHSPLLQPQNSEHWWLIRVLTHVIVCFTKRPLSSWNQPTVQTLPTRPSCIVTYRSPSLLSLLFMSPPPPPFSPLPATDVVSSAPPPPAQPPHRHHSRWKPHGLCGTEHTRSEGA
jgi:hypothetical protein